jgi:hypothetical protein
MIYQSLYKWIYNNYSLDELDNILITDVIKEKELKPVKEDMPKPVIEKNVENTENVQFASSREFEADEDEEMIVEEKPVEIGRAHV